MNLVRYALPTLILAYFLWKALRHRVFLLGIPFLMYMSYSIFFDRLKPFWVPGRLSPADHLMLWLVIVWLLYFDLLLPPRARTKRSRSLFGPRLTAPEETLVVGIAGLVVLELALTVVRVGDVAAVLSEAKGFAYLVAGYFVLRGILCDAGRDETIALVTALVVVDTIAAGLFVLHQGLHLTIYTASEYETVLFMGQYITRSFQFMPQLLLFAVAFCFARRTWNVFWLAILFVSFAALWVSYTRSLVVIALVELMIVTAIRLVKAEQAGLAVKRAVSVVLVVVVFGVIAYVALPVQSRYFLSRIDQSRDPGTATVNDNLRVRELKFSSVWKWTAADHLLGAGLVPSGLGSQAAQVDAMSPDLVWVPVQYRLGLLGVVLLALLFAAAGWRALRLTLTGEQDGEYLALVLMSFIAGLFLQGFVSWTILDPSRYPMALWVFALLAAEVTRRRAEAASQLRAGSAGDLGRRERAA